MITIGKEVREKKEDSKMLGGVWVSLSEIAKSREGAKCGVRLEIMVWILNKFDFTWFFGYSSRTMESQAVPVSLDYFCIQRQMFLL